MKQKKGNKIWLILRVNFGKNSTRTLEAVEPHNFYPFFEAIRSFDGEGKWSHYSPLPHKIRIRQSSSAKRTPATTSAGVEGNGIHATQVSNQDTAVLLHYP
jgi:hypothetical protein